MKKFPLKCLQEKFAALIQEAQLDCCLLDQFMIWVDMKLAEYKAKGVLYLESTGVKPNPAWLQRHKGSLVQESPNDQDPNPKEAKVTGENVRDVKTRKAVKKSLGRIVGIHDPGTNSDGQANWETRIVTDLPTNRVTHPAKDHVTNPVRPECTTNLTKDRDPIRPECTTNLVKGPVPIRPESTTNLVKGPVPFSPESTTNLVKGTVPIRPECTTNLVKGTVPVRPKCTTNLVNGPNPIRPECTTNLMKNPIPIRPECTTNLAVDPDSLLVNSSPATKPVTNTVLSSPYPIATVSRGRKRPITSHDPVKCKVKVVKLVVSSKPGFPIRGGVAHSMKKNQLVFLVKPGQNASQLDAQKIAENLNRSGNKTSTCNNRNKDISLTSSSGTSSQGSSALNENSSADKDKIRKSALEGTPAAKQAPVLEQALTPKQVLGKSSVAFRLDFPDLPLMYPRHTLRRLKRARLEARIDSVVSESKRKEGILMVLMTLERWMWSKYREGRPVESMPAVDLNRYLEEYFRVVRRESGTPYAPGKFSKLKMDLDNFLKASGYPHCLRTSEEFESCREVYLSRFKQLQRFALHQRSKPG